MLQSDCYLFKKEVDWSALHYGVNIPISLQVVFYQSMQSFMKKGDTKDIKLLIEGVEYPAKMTNIFFDERKYPGHKELLQIRYAPNSEIARKIREIFFESFIYLKGIRDKLENKKKQIKTPENKKEYLAIYTTDFEDVFALDCITTVEKYQDKQTILTITEEAFEYSTNYKKDDTADITLKNQLVKIRKLDRSICNNLKSLYDYRCQVTGEKFGDKYNSEVSEAHHIDYFTKSMNNDSDNIVILSPNFHRLIHKTNPVFDRSILSFIFQNGVKEKLKLNYHL